MTRPRSQQVSLESTSYYHCIGRCVRRAFLCGEDPLSGRSFEHRRAWVVERLALLTEVFAIDMCAYAVMSNHYHLVVRINAELAGAWNDHEVASRWMKVFTGPPIVHNWLAGQSPDEATAARAQQEVAKWRERLCDLSWFMRCLNEHIARRANEEDCCTGHFWEGRFKTQALLDEQAVLACMAYVDLNPVRAGIAATPEGSDYTSIQQRILDLDTLAVNPETTDGGSGAEPPPPRLLALVTENTEGDGTGCRTVCDFRLLDYLDLVDWTGRAMRDDKRGAIASHLPPILSRLQITPDVWLRYMRPRANTRLAAIGHRERLKDYARATGRKWVWCTGEGRAGLWQQGSGWRSSRAPASSPNRA